MTFRIVVYTERGPGSPFIGTMADETFLGQSYLVIRELNGTVRWIRGDVINGVTTEPYNPA